jgi:murein DD-endopeptidase MepM/ murein hydrolase activator NlpD
VTTYNHLARALVRVGDVVRRGDVLALSGYSGLDALAAFPWSAPHVHFNVWLDGEYTDPFAASDEVPLWRTGNDPTPAMDDGELPEETRWDMAAVERTIATCRDAEVKRELSRELEPGRRAMNVLFQRNYYPTRFAERPALYLPAHAREPWLDLPFSAEDFSSVTFAG